MDIKNYKGKTVCKADPIERKIEIQEHGYTTTIWFLGDDNIETVAKPKKEKK